MVTKLAIGPASGRLGGALARRLGLEEVQVQHREFPDGETYVKLEGAGPGDTLILVQSLSPPQASNLVILIQMASAASGLGVRRTLAVVPYLAYSRQDKRFLPGEALSSEAVAKTLEASGLEGVYVVEPHSAESTSFFKIPLVSISPFADVIEFAKKRDDYVVVAPDEKRKPDAERLASSLSTDFGWIVKKRDRITGQIQSKIGMVPRSKKAALIFDDIISSGGTIAEASRLLRERGFDRIEAGCVHGLFASRAEERMRSCGVTSIFSSDTIEGEHTKYSVADSIAKSIEKDVP